MFPPMCAPKGHRALTRPRRHGGKYGAVEPQLRQRTFSSRFMCEGSRRVRATAWADTRRGVVCVAAYSGCVVILGSGCGIGRDGSSTSPEVRLMQTDSISS